MKLSVKNFFRILIDLALVALAFVVATFIRLEGDLHGEIGQFLWKEQLLQILPAIVIIKGISFQFAGFYRRFWRYTDVDEIISIAKVLIIPSLLIVAPRLFGYKPSQGDIYAVSYGVFAIDYLMSVLFLSGIRLLRWYIVEQKNIKKRLINLETQRKKTIVIGAGEAALQLIKTVDLHPESGLEIIASLDDDSKKHGMFLANKVEVKGSVEDVKYWVSKLAVDQVVIAIPSLPRPEMQNISKLCAEAGVETSVIPGLDQLAGGKVTVDQIRKLSMEDLLGRGEIDLNIPEIANFLADKRVLITGAGGSIGSELCRQLVDKCNIESLCLLGKGENSIFAAMQELKHLDPSAKLFSKIADVRNKTRMKHVIEEFKPHVIFHAAAHKHVHLMELNVSEAFENNVIGSQVVAELAGELGVETFVLVSTDKAVNPTSVMGATKNLAEKATLLASEKFPKTKYTAVRFGNVLGSRGSVIQVWEKQLRDGQPITVTHKEVIRYFMTIPEASQLVIQAGAKAKTGEIMVLDMGTPVKIMDLAKQFIQLAGFNLDEVPIEVIGLKEGEKLYEELLTADEFIDSKLTDKIFKAKINKRLSSEELADKILELARHAHDNQHTQVRTILMDLIESKAVVS